MSAAQFELEKKAFIIASGKSKEASVVEADDVAEEADQNNLDTFGEPSVASLSRDFSSFTVGQSTWHQLMSDHCLILTVMLL